MPFEARLTHRLRSLELRLNHRASPGRLVRSDYAHPVPDVGQFDRVGEASFNCPGESRWRMSSHAVLGGPAQTPAQLDFLGSEDLRKLLIMWRVRQDLNL